MGLFSSLQDPRGESRYSDQVDAPSRDIVAALMGASPSVTRSVDRSPSRSAPAPMSIPSFSEPDFHRPVTYTMATPWGGYGNGHAGNSLNGLTPRTQRMLNDLAQKQGHDLYVTSAVQGRTSTSNHPNGLAVDIDMPSTLGRNDSPAARAALGVNAFNSGASGIGVYNGHPSSGRGSIAESMHLDTNYGPNLRTWNRNPNTGNYPDWFRQAVLPLAGQNAFAAAEASRPAVTASTKTAPKAAPQATGRPQSRPDGLLAPYVAQMLKDPIWGPAQAKIRGYYLNDKEAGDKAVNDAATAYLEAGGNKVEALNAMAENYPAINTVPKVARGAMASLFFPGDKKLAASQANRMAQPSGVSLPEVPATTMSAQGPVAPQKPNTTMGKIEAAVNNHPLLRGMRAADAWLMESLPSWMTAPNPDFIRPNTEGPGESAGNDWRSKWRRLFGANSALLAYLDDPAGFDADSLSVDERIALEKYLRDDPSRTRPRNWV